MNYIYKKNSTYIYKRRLPLTNKFYQFNTTMKNYKKASKLAIIFNKLSKDIFEYIKINGTKMKIEIMDMVDVLNNYKEKALDQYETLEEDRHRHLAKLFKIEIDDPLQGKIRLTGGNKEVIKVATKSFHNLAVRDYTVNKRVMLKYGKEIVKRTIPEVKKMFQNLRNDDRGILNFISLLLKTEIEIMNKDLDLAEALSENKNSSDQKQNNGSENKSSGYIEEQKKEYMTLDDLVEEFLFSPNHCNYNKDELKDSKKQVYKRNKSIQLYINYIQNKYNDNTAKSLKFSDLDEVFKEILHLKKNTNKEDTKRGITTIKGDYGNLKSFIDYLFKKEYFTLKEEKDFITFYENIHKELERLVLTGNIKDSKDVEAFKTTMLQTIFNEKDNDNFRKVYNAIIGKRKIREGIRIENYWARFYVPIVLFFSGARVSEIAYLKTSECEIKTYEDGIERVLLYIMSNEERTLKTKSSRRMILLQDFLSIDLLFLEYIKKAQREKREYLFNTDKDVAALLDQELIDQKNLTKKTDDNEICFFNSNKDIGYLVSKEFNRDKTHLNKLLTKEDEFKNSKYSLHSFRHNFKTHMIYKTKSDDTVNKLQGHTGKNVSSNYLSFDSADMVDTINQFDLHNRIDWTDTLVIAKRIVI